VCRQTPVSRPPARRIADGNRGTGGRIGASESSLSLRTGQRRLRSAGLRPRPPPPHRSHRDRSPWPGRGGLMKSLSPRCAVLPYSCSFPPHLCCPLGGRPVEVFSRVASLCPEDQWSVPSYPSGIVSSSGPRGRRDTDTAGSLLENG